MRDICKIILNLDKWFRRDVGKNISYLELWWPFCSAKWNHCGILVKEHFCEIILKGLFHGMGN